MFTVKIWCSLMYLSGDSVQVLYLSDVYDHISTVVEDMISLAEDAKDLIDLVRQ
jgi:hypothetical protein